MKTNLNEEQVLVWKRWEDLQRAFPLAMIDQKDADKYLQWWKEYFPQERGMRMVYDLKPEPIMKQSYPIMRLPPFKNKTLIVTPTIESYDCYWDDYWKGIQNLEGNFDFLIIENSDTDTYYNKLLGKARETRCSGLVQRWFKEKYKGKGYWESQEKMADILNHARELFLCGPYTHFLSVEADVELTPSVLNDMLSVGKSVVQAPIIRDGLYLHGSFNNYNSMMIECRNIKEKEFTTGLIPIDWGSVGCCLIERAVLERIPWRHLPGHSNHHDIWFGVDCKNLNFPIYLMPSLKVTHHKRGELNINIDKKKSLKVAFLIEGGFGTSMSGGAKSVVEVANGLVERGHQVTLLSNSQINEKLCPIEINPKVRKEIFMEERISTEYDRYIATFYSTAYYLKRLNVTVKHKFYHCQSYEDWAGGSEAIATYDFDLTRICVSEWVKNMVKGHYAIHPPLNGKIFYNIGRERPIDVLYLSRNELIKCDALGREIMQRVMNLGYSTQIIKHGTKNESEMAELFNKSKVYLNVSSIEGYGRTPMEAIACGCIPVCRYNKGIGEYYKGYIIDNDNPSFFVELIIKAISERDNFDFSKYKFNSVEEVVSGFEKILLSVD
jgi:glycosyltransferase involved in cell wall biosynthesis